jgi:hypothetical protein
MCHQCAFCGSLHTSKLLFIYFLWNCSPAQDMASSSTGFLNNNILLTAIGLSPGDHTHTKRPATFGMTPLNEWSARRRDLYLTTHNTHNRKTSMHPVEFEPTIAAGERLKTYALVRPLGPTRKSKHFLKLPHSEVWRNLLSSELLSCDVFKCSHIISFRDVELNQQLRCY